jgi:hypothetical protein
LRQLGRACRLGHTGTRECRSRAKGDRRAPHRPSADHRSGNNFAINTPCRCVSGPNFPGARPTRPKRQTGGNPFAWCPPATTISWQTVRRCRNFVAVRSAGVPVNNAAGPPCTWTCTERPAASPEPVAGMPCQSPAMPNGRCRMCSPKDAVILANLRVSDVDFGQVLQQPACKAVQLILHESCTISSTVAGFCG